MGLVTATVDELAGLSKSGSVWIETDWDGSPRRPASQGETQDDAENRPHVEPVMQIRT